MRTNRKLRVRQFTLPTNTFETLQGNITLQSACTQNHPTEKQGREANLEHKQNFTCGIISAPSHEITTKRTIVYVNMQILHILIHKIFKANPPTKFPTSKKKKKKKKKL